ncbi:MAG: hypothetical protein QOE70_3603 [Chthoniobacter sp.]|jgi:hypothetical protein|nr:hypothetical protein [Chthoniobacter sp.]
MAKFDYDIFISYSRLDSEWAAKLEDSLPKGLKVFRDVSRINLGDDWDRTLISAVHASRHMILLWSNGAKDSDWVTNERAMFFNIIHGLKPTDEVRNLIAVTLEGDSPVLAKLQTFNDIKLANAYAGGAAAVDATLWNDLLGRVESAVLANDKAVPITTMVFTLKKTELEKLDADQVKPWGNSLNGFLADLGIVPPPAGGTLRDSLLPQYDPSRLQWRPFGNPGAPIKLILDGLLKNLNDRLVGRPDGLQFRLDWVEEDFWTDPAARSNYLAQMQQSLTLLLIDPVAFYEWNVYWLFQSVEKCLGNDQAVVMVLPPFSTAAASTKLQDFLRQAVTSFTHYFQPPIPALAKLAPCGLNVTDPFEIARLLQHTVGQYVRRVQPGAASEYTAF